MLGHFSCVIMYAMSASYVYVLEGDHNTVIGVRTEVWMNKHPIHMYVTNAIWWHHETDGTVLRNRRLVILSVQPVITYTLIHLQVKNNIVA